MDGCASDYPLFEQAITRVVGSYNHDLKLTVVSFISVRAYYAELVNTLPGGVRLQGRLKITEVLEKLSGRNGPHGAPQNPPSEQMLLYTTSDVMSQLVDLRMTNAIVLPGDYSPPTQSTPAYPPPPPTDTNMHPSIPVFVTQRTTTLHINPPTLQPSTN